MGVLMASGPSIDLLHMLVLSSKGRRALLQFIDSSSLPVKCPPEDVTGGDADIDSVLEYPQVYRWAQVTACSEINASVPMIIAAAAACSIGV